MPPIAIAVASLAVSAVGVGASIYQGKKAAKQNAAAIELQRQQANLQNARQKRDAVRASRLAFANAQAAAENQNVSGSSSAEGGQGSIVSQLSDNLSFLDQYGLMTDQAQMHLGKANKYEASARTWDSVSNFAMSVVPHSGEISRAAAKVFKPS